jgi:hypothetical protein
MAVYGEVVGCLIGARADLAKGDNVTLDIPWRQPTGPSMVGPNRSFDYPVKLEARDYSVSELCEILTAITKSNPRLIADPSIENQKLRFGKGELSVWDVLENLYLDKGWKVDEGEEKTLIIQPGVKPDVQAERKKVKAMIDDFWAAIDSGDFDKVRQVSQLEPLGNQDILQKTLIDCNKERKSLLSRGIDTTNVYEVRIEENEAVAVAPANKDRFQWYYLQKDSTGWVIKLFDDAPPSLSMEDIFFKCRSIPKLTVLGAALRLHAAEHNSQCPDTLKALEPYIPHGEIYQWLNDNIEYLGAGKKMQTGGSPDSIIAYTKTLLSKDENLSVLYNDASVSFEPTKKFKQLKTDVPVDVEGAGEKVSRFIGADLPTSVQNLKFHSGSFDVSSKAWMRFDIPLSDLKNLLAKSDKLPDFPDLHKNPKIQKDMDEVYKAFNIEWWKSDELESPVCAAWIKSERAKGAPKVWVIHILNICCSQLKNNLMRVYISLYSHAH